MSSNVPTTVDEYLTRLSDEQRGLLNRLRKTIHAAVPGAEECICYGVPVIRRNGQKLVGFGAAAGHCSFYPMSSTIVPMFEQELACFKTSKGTIRFTSTCPLPAAMVRKLVKARIAECDG